uniref:Alpha/beta fold hydrolase n=1 Tax=Roseihalotalea indica TaxID=2867963 RepID=A0AA49GTL4_9BACT|nr:alpha/beta fold hydrolase [Tunicatimonas sp. TK19036]
MLKTAQGALHGTLVLPEAETPVPVLLFVAGSGPTDRDGNTALLPGKNNSLKILADSLAQHGYASLRYDKRGVGASINVVQAEEKLRFENFVQDAAAWVEQLKQDARFSKVIMLGHSEGSLIGMLAAHEAQTAAYISIAGMAQPADSLLLEQLQTQPDFVKTESRQILTALRQGKTVDSVSKPLYALFRPSVQPYLISWFQYRPTEVIAKLTQPVLIIQGTTDLQVQVKEAERLAQAQPEAKLQIVNEMNHVLKEAPSNPQANLATYSKPDLPLASTLVKSIVTFLEEQAD